MCFRTHSFRMFHINSRCRHAPSSAVQVIFFASILMHVNTALKTRIHACTFNNYYPLGGETLYSYIDTTNCLLLSLCILQSFEFEKPLILCHTVYTKQSVYFIPSSDWRKQFCVLLFSLCIIYFIYRTRGTSVDLPEQIV